MEGLDFVLPFPLSSWAHLVFRMKGSEVSGLNVFNDQPKSRKDRKHVKSTLWPPWAESDLPNNKHGALASRGPWGLFPWLEFYRHTGQKAWSEILTVCFIGLENLQTLFFLYYPSSSDSKESACNVGDPSLIPGLGRSPGEGNSNLCQNSCLENPKDRRAWRAIVHGVTVRYNGVTNTTLRDVFENLYEPDNCPGLL